MDESEGGAPVFFCLFYLASLPQVAAQFLQWRSMLRV